MLAYSSLTILIFCTDKLIKYFIAKTAPDWSLEKSFGVLFCVRLLRLHSTETAVSAAGGMTALPRGYLGALGPLVYTCHSPETPQAWGCDS